MVASLPLCKHLTVKQVSQVSISELSLNQFIVPDGRNLLEGDVCSAEVEDPEALPRHAQEGAEPLAGLEVAGDQTIKKSIINQSINTIIIAITPTL